MILGAGGIPVIAHPWGRESRATMTPDLVAELAELGLVGLEVHHHDHDAATQRALTQLAGELDLVATGRQ